MAKQQLDLNANTKNLKTASLEGLFTSKIAENAPLTETLPMAVKERKSTVRQTFVLEADDMDYLLDLVYTRMIEHGTFTQKEALVEIIRYHRNNNSDIKARPNK